MATIKTIADPRVVTNTNIVFNDYVGPLNWEHYKIPASGLSNSQITFANLVTLGVNRLYSSDFEIQYKVQITLTATAKEDMETSCPEHMDINDWVRHVLTPKAFPLNSCCDQIRANINGAACMSRPFHTLFYREQFWRQDVIDKTCPECPHVIDRTADRVITRDQGIGSVYNGASFPYIYEGNKRYNIVDCQGFQYNTSTGVITLDIREPILCPPFNQRLDQIYQGPLFNITSLDITMTLMDLHNMFKSTFMQPNIGNTTRLLTPMVDMATINISEAKLCFDVASLPVGMEVPATLNLPYYDHVTYVTDTPIASDGTIHEVTSGVYTLAQVPSAIYLFVAPNSQYRLNTQDLQTIPIRHVSITLGNNTQILNTCDDHDLLRMSVANGLQKVDFDHWSYNDFFYPNDSAVSILKLIPGIDVLIPDKRLVGGSDAEQMVFQARLGVYFNDMRDGHDTTALGNAIAVYCAFEYAGILEIAPVHANIDMIPIKVVPDPYAGEYPVLDAVADSSVDEGLGGGEGSGNNIGSGIAAGSLLSFFNNALAFARKAYNSSIGKMIRRGINSVLEERPPPTEMNDTPSTALVPASGAGVKRRRYNTGGTIIGSGKFYD